MTENVLTVKDLTKEFIRGIPVLKNISFSVKEGSSFGFLGKSGSGKSVLMQCIKGVEGYEPTYGSIIYDVSYCPNCYWVDRPSMAGEPCPRCSTKLDFIELDYWDKLKEQDRVALSLFDRVSLMPQRGFALYSEVSALENIMNELAVIGYPAEKRKEHAVELLKQVRLGHRINHIARNLSGGEKQRVIFALSLAKNPILFLADEPTGTLDPITSEMVHNAIRDSISESNISFILTSHWPETVKILSNQAALLDYGDITVMGDPNEVYNTFLGQIEKMEIERKEGGEPVIKVEDVKKYYYTFDRGLTKAVDGVSVDIKDMEILGLVGLSGSGKTSLADMIMGIKSVTTGFIKVKINDEWVDMNIPGPEGRGTATPYMDILHQEYSLHEGEIVLENLVGGIRKDISEEEKLEIAYDVMRSVNFTDDEIDKILYMYPGELSEGERHRVSIAMSLVKQPKIVLLDEPTGTADPITRIEIAKGIRNARDQLGQTYMIISHDIDFIKIVADRAMYMRLGKIIDVGDPDYIVDLMIKTEKEALSKEV
ncbi:methyl coenzyme M reductase system, component A2 [Candidatus Methanoliparum sp. LAM-1]|uniref:methyl coenzyme M reductase system, component A2 n=1 Tax=Candidatus Methanoliparum sp. LAM-1 TaxID=2874846 RepID=UPI001E628A42|nr:methyl coenzyme M reductase system, component A2 [Candidatus Methanoliparum sp. LAM-1]BDC35337.1 ABC-type glutathione transport system [Candidatus Methanoliparum sp. LAM-1]